MTEALRVEVHDTGDGRPQLRKAEEDEIRGRGLFLIDSLADDWGYGPRNGPGKSVWVEFKFSAAPSAVVC
ncbi:hypothetical protein Sm713_13000 [Streptomyces sp. TS71-3]|nr:hypothetical protein Sm713_13000 [Streptomyces sp. TS71-3]